jgi:hypothetical protein
MTGDYHGTLFTANTWIMVEGDTASAVSDFLEVEAGTARITTGPGMK